MKNDTLSLTLKRLFVDVILKGSLGGAVNAVRSFIAEHEKEFNDLVQRSKETED